MVLRCKQQPEEPGETEKLSKANFHHVHLNVTDRDSTIAYYQKYFGATRVKYKDRVDALFSEKSFYKIPEYQRAYVWKEEQIEVFLKDISTAMQKDMEKEYFLGCMIWNTKKVVDENNNSYNSQDILDGQQRFITMYILQGVLRDLSDDSEFKETVNKCLKQKENKFRRPN